MTAPGLPGARGDVDGVFQDAGNGAIVLRRDKKHGIGRLDFVLQPLAHRRVAVVKFLGVEREIVDLDIVELQLGARELFDRAGQLEIDGIFPQTSDQNGYIFG